MATWASLTPTEQADVQAFMGSLRAFAGDLAILANEGVAVGAAWNGGLSTIVGTLGADEVIPNASGLDGAQGVVPADVANMAGYLIDLSNPANNVGGGGYNTAFHRALMVKLAGITNTLVK